jgi:hypothetical protein
LLAQERSCATHGRGGLAGLVWLCCVCARLGAAHRWLAAERPLRKACRLRARTHLPPLPHLHRDWTSTAPAHGVCLRQLARASSSSEGTLGVVAAVTSGGGGGGAYSAERQSMSRCAQTQRMLLRASPLPAPRWRSAERVRVWGQSGGGAAACRVGWCLAGRVRAGARMRGRAGVCTIATVLPPVQRRTGFGAPPPTGSSCGTAERRAVQRCGGHEAPQRR